MSGLPNTTGVSNVASAIKRMQRSRDRAQDLRDRIKQDQSELASQELEYRTAQELVLKELNSMDVASTNNYGWQGRFSAFLMMLLEPSESGEGK